MTARVSCLSCRRLAVLEAVREAGGGVKECKGASVAFEWRRNPNARLAQITRGPGSSLRVVGLMRRVLGSHRIGPRALRAQSLFTNPGRSNNWHARNTRTNHVTVGEVREALVEAGLLKPRERTIGLDGRARPVRRAA